MSAYKCPVCGGENWDQFLVEMGWPVFLDQVDDGMFIARIPDGFLEELRESPNGDANGDLCLECETIFT